MPLPRFNLVSLALRLWRRLARRPAPYRTDADGLRWATNVFAGDPPTAASADAYIFGPAGRPPERKPDARSARHLPRYVAGFAGTIPATSLRPAGAHRLNGATVLRYACPCGGAGHYATRASDFPGGLSSSPSPVLNCYETGRRWHVADDVPSPADVVRGEEEKYAGMLAGAARHVRRAVPDPSAVTGAALARLYHTHGIDPVAAEDVLSASFPSAVHDDYQRAMAEHRATGSATR